MDAIYSFADHVIRTGYADLPAAALGAAKSFVLDTLGVALVGSSGPWAAELVELQKAWGSGEAARIWSYGNALPAPAAAMCNAYQAHNCEFDCVHEGAVVHALSAVVPASIAVAEREGGFSGRDLMTAVVLGVDVACHLGVAATTGLRFFRPGTAGALGATAAIGKLLGFHKETLVNAFSIAYGQLCGTMQAHSEGSMLLGMQMAFNARNAVTSADMAAAGLRGPGNILEGEFGYFGLIEGAGDLAPVLEILGRRWRITEMAHKPYPSGRATHGVIDATLALRKEHNIAAQEVAAVAMRMPPLTEQLVGRPVLEGMEINYARLCAAYTVACALRRGMVSVDDFRPQALGDEETLALARKVHIAVDDLGDPNALTPVDVEIELADGCRLAQHVAVVYGHPERAMSRDDLLAKFRRNAAAAARPLPEPSVDGVIAQIDALEELDDVRGLVDFLIA